MNNVRLAGGDQVKEMPIAGLATELGQSRAVPALPQFLLRAPQAAALCSKALRTWRSWDAAGLIPRPVRIGRSTLWRANELQAWVAAGCPKRCDWESRKS
jgi:predicted DNA-binding transcriptional regulator AlpA